MNLNTFPQSQILQPKTKVDGQLGIQQNHVLPFCWEQELCSTATCREKCSSAVAQSTFKQSSGVWSKAHGERSQRIYNHLSVPSPWEKACAVVIRPRGGIPSQYFFRQRPVQERIGFAIQDLSFCLFRVMLRILKCSQCRLY